VLEAPQAGALAIVAAAQLTLKPDVDLAGPKYLADAPSILGVL
jgi:hypothetical protein